MFMRIYEKYFVVTLICTGKSFVYFWATYPRFVVRDPETAKEVFVNNHSSLKRTELEEKITTLVVGKGLFTLLGEKWATERKILAPFFHQDALKVWFSILKALRTFTIDLFIAICTTVK